MTDSEKHEFETKDGKVFEFDSEEERNDFSVRYTMGTLVAEGYGEFVIVDGEEGFRINDKGLAYLAEQERLSVSANGDLTSEH